MMSEFAVPMEELSKFEKAAAKVAHWYSLSRIQKVFRFHLWYLAYQLSKKHSRKVHARTFWGAEFSCYLPDYFLTWRYGVLGDPSEIALTRYFLKNVKPNDVFFDVGANCGFYTLLAGHLVGAGGAVHAFEPTPDIFQMLQKNASEVPHAHVNQLAVAAKTGESEFSMHPIFTVVNSLSETSSAPSASRVTVQTISLDGYAERSSVVPTFIKIDVEGAEELVIQGARRILTEHSPVVSLEILGTHNTAHLRAVSLLLDMEYRAHRITATGELELVLLTADNLKTFFGEGRGFDNFIFKKA
jgi:FkbM family methyltransferase